MSKLNLSASLITLNEGANLARCLDSIKDLVDEIVVVDSGSSDKTVEIAKKYGAKIYVRSFDNYASQRNFAAEKASGEWILSIDGDEVIPEDLAQEIKKAIAEKSEYSAYEFGRRNFILGAEIKHTRWSPDKHIWLWRKDLGHWTGEVHEELVTLGKVGELIGRKIHYQDKSLGEFYSSNLRYAKFKASEIVEKGGFLSIWRIIWDPTMEFGIRFIYRAGFLDGWRGLVLSGMMALYWFQVWSLVIGIKLGLVKKVG